MKPFIIFILFVLSIGQEAKAKDQPDDLSKFLSTRFPPNYLEGKSLSQKVLIEQQLEKKSSPQEIMMMDLISDVVCDKAAVRPSMVPPEIFDRIYFVEKRTQEIMEALEKANPNNPNGVATAKGAFYLGQLIAMKDMLYVTGILPVTFYSYYNVGRYYEMLDASVTDRMRLITTMLLLLNYKESNPVPPGDMVQVVITK